MKRKSTFMKNSLMNEQNTLEKFGIFKKGNISKQKDEKNKLKIKREQNEDDEIKKEKCVIKNENEMVSEETREKEMEGEIENKKDEKDDILNENNIPLHKMYQPFYKEDYINEVRSKKNPLLKKLLQEDLNFNLIIYGPPGSGKSSLINVIRNKTKNFFTYLFHLNNFNNELRKIYDLSVTNYKLAKKKTILCVKDINRLNKSQQESLLLILKKGHLFLLATSLFSPMNILNAALSSRCLFLYMYPYDKEELRLIIERIINKLDIKIEEDALNIVIKHSCGDARVAINIIDFAIQSMKQIELRETVKDIKLGENMEDIKSGESIEYIELREHIKDLEDLKLGGDNVENIKLKESMEDIKLGENMEDIKSGESIEYIELREHIKDLEDLKLGDNVENIKLKESVGDIKLGENIENNKLGENVENNKLGENIENNKLGEKNTYYSFHSEKRKCIQLNDVKNFLQNFPTNDNKLDHYNFISGLHKSIRAGNIKAAILYLTKSLKNGEDPLYICRRLIRIASEDIGLANHNVLSLCVNTHYACKAIGMPECQTALIYAVIVLCKSSKSNYIYLVEKNAKEICNEYSFSVPFHLKNTSNKYIYTNQPEILTYDEHLKKYKDVQKYLPDHLENLEILPLFEL